MRKRYCFEIADGPSNDCWFAYFDSVKHLALLLFAYENVDVTIEGEFGSEHDPYRIFLCRIPGKDRAGFLKAIDRLPALMAQAGYADYDDFCRGVMQDAAGFLAGRKAAGRKIPLQ